MSTTPISSGNFHLICGLGNPGSKYENTRHNIGFMILQRLASQNCGSFRVNKKLLGYLSEFSFGEKPIRLLMPNTYMNESGRSGLAARDFYKLADDALLVVCDDFNLPLSKLRVRPGGGSGGQKGLAEIVHRLGSDQVPRLRLGIGPVPENWNPAGFVLGKFDRHEQKEVGSVVTEACQAVALWVTDGVDKAMNRFNGEVA